MLLRVPTTNGIKPRVSARLLDDSFAQVANNCKLWNGTVRGWRAPVAVADLPDSLRETIYRFGQDSAVDTQYWFSWDSDVDVVRSPIAGNERTFFSGDGLPQVTDSVLALTGGGALPNVSYDLGVPSPTQTPTAVVTGTAATGAQAVSRYYVYTFVNDWGEEGGVSPVSGEVVAYSGQTVTLSSLEVPTGDNSYSVKRIYETQGIDESAGWYLKAEVSAALTSASVPAASAAVPNPTGNVSAVGSLLITQRFAMPPADLTCLTMLGADILCGISGNAVRMCEPGYPYAWPARYEFKFDHEPIAIASFGNTLVVGTRGVPYVIQGFEPTTMQQTKIEREYACVSKRSMVSVGGGVAYASPDGMILVDAGGATNITEPFIDPDQWKAYDPTSMHAYWWDNQLVIFYDTGTVSGGIILPPGREPTTIDLYTPGAYVDPQFGHLYLIDGSDVMRFDDEAGAAGAFTWRSKIFQVGRRLNFGAAQVHCTGPVTLKVYADGVLRHTQVVASTDPFRLPGGFLASEWEFELTGTGEVLFPLAVAETMAELKAA